jgi:uncharacterized membrane protein
MYRAIFFTSLGMAAQAVSAGSLAWTGLITLSPGQQLIAAGLYLIVAAIILLLAWLSQTSSTTDEGAR